MTCEEALKYLDEHCTAIAIPLEVKIICSQALEKQIPKKVVYEPKAELLRYCPTCNVRFIAYRHSYCSDCGQRLDWGDER